MREIQVDFLEPVAVDLPILAERSRKRDVVEEVAGSEAVGKIIRRARTAAAGRTRKRQEKAAERGREEARLAVVVGIFGAHLDGIDWPQVEPLLIVGVTIPFLVAVGDLVQRPEVESEIGRIRRVNAVEGDLRSSPRQVEIEAGRGTAFVEGLSLGVAVSLGISCLEVHGGEVARVPQSIEVARPHFRKSEPVDGVEDDSASAW